MPRLFSRPIDEIERNDVQALIGWPEGLAVEYKRELPGRDGRQDAWLTTGDRVEAYARDKLCKELVAFANTTGGHLILGLDETNDTPALGKAIVSIPRCGELAERLERAVQLIDPPIRLLQVKAVPMDEGGNGVLVFRVPQSPSAPHRAPDKECYVRRGANSVPVSMREIQELTLASYRVADRLEETLERARSRFDKWFRDLSQSEPMLIGFHLAALPIDGTFTLPRLEREQRLERTNSGMLIKVNGQRKEGYPLRFPEVSRPMIRGRRWTSHHTGHEPSYLEQHQDGLISIGFRNVNRLTGLHPGWIVGYLQNLLNVIDVMREKAQAPESEYAVQLHVRGCPSSSSLRLLPFDRHGDDIGSISECPLDLPRLIYGAASDKWKLTNELLADIIDATGEAVEMLLEPVN